MTDVESKWHVEIDTDLCIGSGACVAAAPEAFELDVYRQSCVKHALLAPSDAVLEAAKACPTEAISISADGTGQKVFPLE